jgi:ATP-dependent helicase Lhr and Lhr-like helicase
MALEYFTPATRRWFESAFGAPTPAQEQSWPAIARGEHVLVCAPTGSGKTLAAFMWALDRLLAADAPGEGVRVVYVSPLKALAYDIERNLRAPLRGIGAEHIRVAIRTGDTPQRERAAMARKPPDILVTTPESLYLILTSRARAMLTGAEAVIVDEIHAVAATKRGSHLALTLERLEQQAAASGGLQRIGLSATQNPLEEVARFLGGPRQEVTIVDAGVRKPLDLRIEVPVESMSNLDGGPGPDRAGVDAPELEGWESPERSIWPAIYPELLRQVREHNSTIIFVNNRRAAERVALRLNELAAAQDGHDPTGEARQEIARAHHGSLAREERTKVEELLKAGRLPCLVATSSLELGIDMGAVDLVLQIESPKSVARGLQRIGRAGHGVGELSVGRIFPKFRGDLLESAVLARRMREGLIEPTVVPRNALDVLAQQIVAIAVSAEDTAGQARPGDEKSGDGESGDVEPGGHDGAVSVDELHELVRRTHSYSELSRELLENVLDMLDGRYPSQEFGELRARIVWDRLAGTIRARRGARQLAVANAGTIPDRGLYMVTLPDGRRVGELDEEMVYEMRAGQTFLLGASSWRIEDIGRDRVVVTPAPGVPGAVPFWKGDSVGREKELGAAIGAFSRWAVEQDAETLERDYDLDERAARNLLEYLSEQQQATRVLPSDRTIVLERFRDEIGDWRLCVLSPYGGRVHSAWALALSASLHERFGVEADAIAADDGIALHLPDLDADGAESLPSAAELLLLDPEEVERAVTDEVGGSALFGARFRENAARALLIPRAFPGRRTPLWQQRLKAQNLLEVARRYSDFPIVLETYRECLRDVLDVPGLQALLRDLHAREVSLVEVETRTASPFASSLLFDYVASYMYEGDTPTAERRAAVLSLDRDLLRELLGQEELRELIDAGALERVEDDLQRRSEMTRATGSDELHDVLRRVGELDEQEARERVFEGVDATALLGQLVGERRAVRLRLAGRERYIAADEAGLYRDALGAAPPGGLPEAFVAPVEDALTQLVARYARTHGPFTTAQLHQRYGVDAGSTLRELERAGTLVRGELRPGGSEREWCDVEVLRRLRRASLAALRKEIEPADERRLASFLPAWQGIDRRARAGAGVDRLREVLVPLQGLALPVESWERDVIPRRTGAYSPSWLDELCASGELTWVGAGPLGRSGRVALYFREDAPSLGRAPVGGSPAPPSGVEHERVRACLRRGPCFFSDLLLAFDGPAEALREALWDLVWAGEVTNDAWAPLRAPRLTLARGSQPARPAAGAGAGVRATMSARSRFGSRRRSGAQSQVQGRWSLTDGIFGAGEGDPAAAAERRRALAELLLERYGIVTREQVLAENVRGGFSSLYDTFNNLETLGVCRRGYFIEGMGAAQFALPGAVERLRSDDARESTLVIAATDPAQPYGAALAWPKRERERGRPARTAGAYLVLAGEEPALYLERGGRSLLTLVEPEAGGLAGAFAEQGGPLRAALEALAEAVRAGKLGRVSLERIDGEPAMGSPLAELLVELGFHSGPRRLILSG